MEVVAGLSLACLVSVRTIECQDAALDLDPRRCSLALVARRVLIDLRQLVAIDRDGKVAALLEGSDVEQ